MLHGLVPGPLLFQQNGDLIFNIFASMMLATVFMAILMWAGMRMIVKILKIPSHILIPLIVVLCSIGAYALGNRVFDMWGLLLFGVIGVAMKHFKIPVPPFILGFILEGSLETNLRRGLQYSNGNYIEVFTRPISAMFLILTVLSLGMTFYKQYSSAKKEKRA